MVKVDIKRLKEELTKPEFDELIFDTIHELLRIRYNEKKEK